MHKKTPKVDIEDVLGNEITSEHDLLAEPDETITQNDATTRAKGSSTAKRHFKRSALLNKHFYFIFHETTVGFFAIEQAPRDRRSVQELG